MGAVRNLLFIMADRPRWDVLSCCGKSKVDSLNIDSLAMRCLSSCEYVRLTTRHLTTR